MVSTHLKNISQIGSFHQIGVKMRTFENENIWFIWFIPSHSPPIFQKKNIQVAVITLLCGWYDHRPQQEDTKCNAKLHHVLQVHELQPNKKGAHESFELRQNLRAKNSCVFEVFRRFFFSEVVGAGYVISQIDIQKFETEVWYLRH